MGCLSLLRSLYPPYFRTKFVSECLPWHLVWGWDDYPNATTGKAKQHKGKNSVSSRTARTWNNSKENINIVYPWGKIAYGRKGKLEGQPSEAQSWRESSVKTPAKGLNVPSQFLLDIVSSRFDGVISICCDFFFFLEASLEGPLISLAFSLLGTPAALNGLPHLISAGCSEFAV